MQGLEPFSLIKSFSILAVLCRVIPTTAYVILSCRINMMEFTLRSEYTMKTKTSTVFPFPPGTKVFNKRQNECHYSAVVVSLLLVQNFNSDKETKLFLATFSR